MERMAQEEMKAHLMATNEEFRQLAQQHSEYARKLDALEAAGVTRAIKPQVVSVTQRLPSGPVVMPPGLETVGRGYSVISPVRVIFPTLSP